MLPARACVVQNDRDIPSRPVEVWLCNLKHKACGGGSIESIAAALQYCHGHLAANPMRAGCNTKGACDFWSCGEHIVCEMGSPCILRALFSYMPGESQWYGTSPLIGPFANPPDFVQTRYAKR